MDMQKKNYEILREIAPEITTGESKYMCFGLGEKTDDFLYITFDKNGFITLLKQRMKDGDFKDGPQATFILDHQRQILFPVQYKRGFSDQTLSEFQQTGCIRRNIHINISGETIGIYYDEKGRRTAINGPLCAQEAYLKKAEKTVTKGRKPSIPER